MRIKPEIAHFFNLKITKLPVKAECYLFGSRTDNAGKGGDIDILILSEKVIERKILRQIKVDFFKQFGWQKLDLINFAYDDPDPFKAVILDEAIQL
jgi:uncharacterized protein